MSYVIEVQNPHGYDAAEAELVRAAEMALTLQNAPPGAALTVRIDDDDAVAELNRAYRGVDSATDVLSFPADLPQMAGEAPYLGDLIVAYPYAATQAAREQHPLQASLALLVVHGVLHLLGFDHNTPDARAQMWAVQDGILQKLNIPLDIVPTLEAYEQEDESDY